jgi:hypothetical protein
MSIPAFRSINLMNEKKYFTAREIDALIPRLEHIFNHIQTCKSRAEELAAQLLHVPETSKPQDEVQAQLLHSQVEFLMSAVQEDVDMVHGMGGVIKDIEIGLVDFLGDVEGQDVWLCWKSGESAVRYWHSLDSGFSQRRMLRPVFPNRAN